VGFGGAEAQHAGCGNRDKRKRALFPVDHDISSFDFGRERWSSRMPGHRRTGDQGFGRGFALMPPLTYSRHFAAESVGFGACACCWPLPFVFNFGQGRGLPMSPITVPSGQIVGAAALALPANAMLPTTAAASTAPM
jgi:hypothetical protein